VTEQLRTTAFSKSLSVLNSPLRQPGKHAMGTGPSQSAVWVLAFEPKMQVSKDVPQSQAAKNTT